MTLDRSGFKTQTEYVIVYRIARTSHVASATNLNRKYKSEWS